MTPTLSLHHLDRSRLPVVLLGGINLVRTLGLAGIPAIVATSNLEEPALASRHCSGSVQLPRFDGTTAPVDALVALGDRLAAHFGRRVPLMYGSDEALEMVQAHRERLARYFLFMVCDPDVSSALIAKDRFQAFAKNRGLPVPAPLRWQGDGPGTLRGAAGPVVAKPRHKANWSSTALYRELFDGAGKARIFSSGAEAADHPVVRASQASLAFQEYIPGDDPDHWAFNGFADERGEVLACFTGRKIRTFPAGAGESAFIEVAPHPELEAVGRDIARRCPLKGAFKMDFKRDPRDGRWHLLEINARYTLWQYLGARNGLNLMDVAYGYMVHGARPEQATCASEYRWLSLGLDFRAYRQLCAEGKLSLAGWVRSIMASRNVYNVLAWDDMGPFRAQWLGRFTRRWHRGSGRMLTALRQWRSTAS